MHQSDKMLASERRAAVSLALVYVFRMLGLFMVLPVLALYADSLPERLFAGAVEEARAAGIEDFVFVTSRGKTALEDHFDHRPELEKNVLDSGKKHLLYLNHFAKMF